MPGQGMLGKAHLARQVNQGGDRLGRIIRSDLYFHLEPVTKSRCRSGQHGALFVEVSNHPHAFVMNTQLLLGRNLRHM